jgi:predicted acetyltransferase
MPALPTIPDFELRSAAPSDRLPIYRMLELYQHDLSDVWDQDLDGHGEYGYQLDEYWSDKKCRPYVVLVDSRYAGFALVNEKVILPEGDFWLAQFFIAKKFRRRGLGSAVASALFSALPGRWQVGQMPLNYPAQAFWRSAIGKHTSGKYVESRIVSGLWQGTLQQFTS